MPRISFFHGITITMHWNEGSHSRPHFHARSSGQKASFAFDGSVIVGALPARQAALVGRWAALHGDELGANWQRARLDQALAPIDPLP
jgi:hypothetical protein